MWAKVGKSWATKTSWKNFFNRSLGRHLPFHLPVNDWNQLKLLKKLKQHITFFTKLLNRIFYHFTYLKIWKIATIIPTLKLLKDKSHPLSYRPIFLFSVLSKILRRIPSKRSMYFLHTNRLISQWQYGGRRDRSSTMALADLEFSIRDALTNKANLSGICWLGEPFPSPMEIPYLQQLP